ncbi:MAG: cation-transporting P-type ATPase, partial [Pseudomonadota bacterium]
MDKPAQKDQLQETNAWHVAPTSTVLEQLKSTRAGLTSTDAEDRLSQYGQNQLPEGKRRSGVQIILGQLGNSFTFILLVAAIVSLSLGHGLDAGFIMAVVVINTTIGAAQEWRAEMNAASLKKTFQVRSMVQRDGQKVHVSLEDIVPGDIVMLESGNVVPADIRLLSDTDLRTDES